MSTKRKKYIKKFVYKEQEIEAAIESVQSSTLPDSLKPLLVHCLEYCLTLASLMQKNRRLRRIISQIFGFSSELRKKETDSSQSSEEASTQNPECPGENRREKDNTSEEKSSTGQNNSGTSDNNGNSGNQSGDKKNGHGRRSHKDLPNTEHVNHDHPDLKSGAPCSEDWCDGKVYLLKNPGVFVRISAQEPIRTTIHLVQKYRCNLCLKIFQSIPEGIGDYKYDADFLSFIVMQKCYFGVSMQRVASSMELSSSVISEQFSQADSLLSGVFEILLDTLANDDCIAFDDTKSKIQPSKKAGPKHAWASVFTGKSVVLYLVSREHAGKKLEKILKKRKDYLLPPIALSDALPSYEGYKKDTLDVHCLTHARRRFHQAKEEDEGFCTALLEQIGEIYHNDSQTKGLSPEERRDYHALHSRPLFNKMMDQLQDAVQTNRYRPNDDLYSAVNYWCEHMNKLTEFTRTPGIPLDTNQEERKIKNFIRLRKQAPIFKTEQGALRTGRLLSLIETCLFIQVDPKKYLAWAINGRRKGLPPQEVTPWAFKQSHETPPPPQ